MTTVAEFQAAVDAARAQLEPLEAELGSVYGRALAKIATEASERFTASVTGRFLTAATDPAWTPPPAEEVAATAASAAAVEQLAQKRRRALQVLALVFEDRVEIGFDVGGVYSVTLLEGLGRRASVELTDEVVQTVSASIADSFEQGLSVEQAAEAIRAKVDSVAASTARMLARTDMIGLANGGALLAAKAVYPDGGVDKVWLTAHDERVRDTHVAAEGQRVPIDQPFAVGEAQLQFPGDPNGPDAEVIQCRCVLLFEEVAAPALVASAVDFADGTMVAVYPTPEQAEVLAVPGGQPADDLHVTLAFLPDGLTDYQHAALVETLLIDLPAGILDGQVGGMGRFQPGDAGVPQIALPSVDGLAEMRQAVVATLDDLGVAYARNWGWCPHITLAYTEADDATVPDRRGMALTFSEVAVKRGTETTLIPLEPGGTDMTQTAEAATTELAPGATWESVLCVEGVVTEDGRLLELGSIGWRELPLTLMAQTEFPEFGGHAGAQVAGRIDGIRRNGAEIVATGVFDDGDFGRQVQGLVEDQTLRGVSVDLAILDYEYRDAETGKVLDDDEIMDALFDGREVVFVVLDGKIGAATVCAFQAIEDATIALAASAHRPLTLRLTGAFTIPASRPGLVASGIPERAPSAWFDDPGFMEPTPLAIDETGRISGHIARWGHCHTGIQNDCVLLPQSRTNYALFHVGSYLTAEGEQLPIGRLTADATHADLDRGLSIHQVRAHYDNSSSIGAYVRAGEDEHGVWIAGTVEPTISSDVLRRMRACPVSGDWRDYEGNLELVATLSVPVPGFPVPHAEVLMAVTSSGAQRVEALILSSAMFDCDDCEECDEQVIERRIRVLAARATGGIDGLAELATREAA